MNIAPLQPKTRAADLPLERLADNPALSEEEKVSELSRQFESVLLRQILREAQKPVFHSALASDSTIRSIYQDMVVEQLADSVSRSGTFGVATSLRDQVGRQPRDGVTRHEPLAEVRPPEAHTET